MLCGNQNNQNAFFHSECPATIAALLMKTPPSLLTVSAFQTIQELVELFNREQHTRADIYKHLIFDFRVWSRPAYCVRIGELLLLYFDQLIVGPGIYVLGFSESLQQLE